MKAILTYKQVQKSLKLGYISPLNSSETIYDSFDLDIQEEHKEKLQKLIKKAKKVIGFFGSKKKEVITGVVNSKVRKAGNFKTEYTKNKKNKISALELTFDSFSFTLFY